MASSQDLPKVDLTGTITDRQFKQLKCINRRCNHGDDLREAIELTCSYYHVDYRPGKEVCSHCFHQCISHYKHLQSKWSSGECVLKTKFPDFISHHVIESSSSSEDEEESSSSKNVFDEKLSSVMLKAVEKWFDENDRFIGKQVKMCNDYLKGLQDMCYKNMHDLNQMSYKAENQLYKLRAKVYEPFKPILKYEPSVDLTESNFKRANEDTRIKQYKKSKLEDKNKENKEEDIELVCGARIWYAPADLPDKGPQEYPPLKDGDWVFFMKSNVHQPWSKGKIKFMVNKDYVHIKSGSDEKLVTTKEVAYFHQNPVEFKVGSRVIAMSGNSPMNSISNSFINGVIGEPPTLLNKFRYLIFFDSGCVEYRSHKDIRLIVHPSVNVWNDVENDLKEFLQNYLVEYPERQMVKLTKQDNVRVFSKERWVVAKVMEVDASLVKLYFTDSKVYEWIYRGSSRLWKMYEKQNNSEKGKRLRQSGLAYLNKPIIEFTSIEESKPEVVAPISTTSECSTSSQSDKHISDYNDLCKTTILTLPKNIPQTKKFVVHDCNNSCIEWTAYDYNKTKRMNMLSIPLHFGYKRCIVHFNNTQKCVMYVCPCGRIIRNLKEMFEYLITTRSKMTIDQFDYNSWVKPLAEFRVLQSKQFLNDLSVGKEFRGITCVNSIDHKVPPPMEYMTSRQAMPGVNINVESSFLCGCTCTDNCQDKSKCSCWQFTIEGQKILPNLYKDPNIGYNYRRLHERVLTGIYECNKTCKCSSSCLNRVVQYPLTQKLQLFLTENKGWGVRCLNDIPQGSFICIYVGYLLTETDANEGGINYGDEYLAELDYIEVVEKIKEDYESDVPLSDQENSDSNDDSFRMTESSDEDYQSTSEGKSATSEMSLRLRKRKQPTTDTKTKKDNFISKSSTCNMKNDPNPPKSIREYYGENESVYIMDAKTSGNIGRYLNHSCSPNTFVQNVFVDTHDLRFPWVSFFALHYIQAGTELTWDYSYDVGSVPGKIMKCHCGSVHCRGRLL